MNKEQLVKDKNEFLSQLEITEERGNFLSKTVEDLYKNGTEKETVVDLLFAAREYAKTGSEDMFVCYIVGFIHAQRMFQAPAILIHL